MKAPEIQRLSGSQMMIYHVGKSDFCFAGNLVSETKGES